MKKKIMSLLICVAMVSTLLVGCGEKEAPAAEPVAEATDVASEEEVVPETEVAPTTEEAVVETTEEAVAETTEEAEEVAEYVPGTWDGNVYTNTSLGFSMTVPDTYTIITGDSLKNVGNESVTCEFMALAEDNASNFTFSTAKLPIELSAEQYADMVLKGLDVAGIQYELVSELTIWEAANLDFYQMDMTISAEGQTISQSQIFHIDKNYIYLFVLSMQEETADELFSVINSIEAIN